MKIIFRSLVALFLILFTFTTPVSPDTYRIREGDLLAISIWMDDYYQIQRVRHDGRMVLPPYGDLYITGLTPNDARDLITSYLREYYQDPLVVLEVKMVSPMEISIMGAVKNPGLYSLPYQSRVLYAIKEAGGLRDEAHQSSAYINREGFLIPIGEKEGQGLMNYSLKTGDVINVPFLDYQVHFMGEVEKPGSYGYLPGMTLLKGLIQAGGITWRGDERDILILRQAGKTTDYIEVNLQEILKQEVSDPLLEPGDRVLVGGRALFQLTNLSFVLITVPLLLFVLLN